MSYHNPVMLDECVDGLAINPEGVYVDVTFGGGGHSKAILKKITTGKLLAFDQDEDAKINAEEIEDSSFIFIEANFRHLKRFLRLHGIKRVDGILADLGVSSHQIDTAERGFSTRFSADLDMRMNKNSTLTARDVVNDYSEQELHRVLGMYGEVRNAKTLAASIVTARESQTIDTIDDLKIILERHAKRGKEFRYYAQVFQAFRIEVNDEMKALEEMLSQSSEVLKTDGRLVVMSYHSLEDRIVKNFIAKGKVYGEVEKDFFGNMIRPLEPVNRKLITASEEELKLNNRARSAKLRIARKLK